MARIVVVGSSNTDLVIRVPRLPHPGETVLGGEFLMVSGGKGANQAVAAARLGAQVTLVARIGNDIFGKTAMAGLRKENVATQYVTVDDEAPSGVALIAVDDRGENSVTVAPGANARLSPNDVIRARSAIQHADVVLLQLEVPMETVIVAADLAHEAGVQVLLNPAPAPQLPLGRALLENVAILTPNEHEVALLANTPKDVASAAHKMRRYGVETVVVTLGSLGALVATGQGTRSIMGFEVETRDTTGAGDAFNGGLGVGLASGMELEAAVGFANACGALSTTRLGAQSSLPTANTLHAFMANQTAPSTGLT